MKIELPVPYEYKVRLIRSKNGKTEDEMACSMETFEIPDYSSVDVHLVAEWRQGWRKDRHIPTRQVQPSSGNWNQDFQADPHLARLALIDGKLHAPLHINSQFRSAPLLTHDLIPLMASQNMATASIFGDHHSKLWNFQVGKDLQDSGFKTTGETAFTAIPEETRNRTVIESGLENKRAQMNSMLKSLVIVDNVVFVAVEEPCIAVEITKDSATIKIKKWDDDAYADTQLFSLADFDAANEYFLTNRIGKITRQVDAARVFITEVLKSNVEQDELLRSVDNFIGCFDGHLFELPKDIAVEWYTLRDLHRSCGSNASEEQLDTLKEVALNLTAAINNNGTVSSDVKDIAALGATLAERWELRPMSI
jgi:hypothetical protein